VDNIGDVAFDDLEKWHCILSVRVVGENTGVQNAPRLDLGHDAAVDAQPPPLEAGGINKLDIFRGENRNGNLPSANELDHAVSSYCHTSVNPTSRRQ